jgi:hypothetical protein
MKPATIERRGFELRATLDGQRVSGLAVPYGKESLPLPFTEIIRAGAFRDSLTSRNIGMYVEHDSGRVLANTRSGTLRLDETPEGIRFAAMLPATQDGNDVRALLDAGIYSQMSFGFIATEDEWEKNTRYVNRAELFEISIVHNAAYGEETEAALRNRCNVPRPDLRRRYLRLRFGELNR